MNLLTNYDEFKLQCEDFGVRFYKKYFSDADFVCHPKREGLLLTPCSPEESRANTQDICRVGDLLLMSEDGQKWEAFDLTKAREIAAENGSVYLTDLCGENSFEAFDWMINGKNDTIVVSIQYMKDKGKQYAPITPLTNIVIPFRKVTNAFFWQADDEIIPSVLSFEGVKKWLSDYSEKCAEECPKLKFAEKVSFPLFDLNVVIDINTTRVKQVNRFFEHIGKIADDLKSNISIIEAAGLKFSVYDFLTDLVVKALVSDGIAIDTDKFVSEFFTPIERAGHDGGDDRLSSLDIQCSDKNIDCIKLAYLDALTKLGGMDFEYNINNSDKYYDEMHAIEQGDIEKDEEKFLLAALLSRRPANCSVFAYIENRYPEEKTNLAPIKEYWGVPDDTEENLIDSVLSTYLDDSDTLGDGSFIMPLEKAEMVRDSLKKVLKKYGFGENDYVNSLDGYITDLSTERRTFGDTVLESAEDVGKAEMTEKEVADMCADLTALNKDELQRLRKYVYSTKLDSKIKGKYLLKIKLALAETDKNELAQMTLGLFAMNAEEAATLGQKILSSDYDDVIVMPVIAKINDRIYSLKAHEFAAQYAGIDEMNPEELDAAAEKLKTEKADPALIRHYRNKINIAKDKYYIKLLLEATEDWENRDIDTLAELMTAISDTKKYPAKYADPFINKIGFYIENYDKIQLDKLFADINEADAESLDLIAESASLYDAKLTEPYMKRIEARRAAILRAEQNAQLYREISRVGAMNAEELETLQKTLDENRSLFPDEEFEKINRDIEARFEAIEDEKLVEIEISIPEMDMETAHHTMETLTDGTYEPGKTAPLVKSLKDRIDQLYVIEMDEICSGMEHMEKEELEAVRQKIAALSYPDVIKNRTLNQIDRRIAAVNEAHIEKLIGYLSSLSEKEALEVIRRIQMMQTDDAIKSRYIDKLEAHIIKLREEEAQQYVAILEAGMKDGAITPAMLCIYGSALFPNKVDAAGAYASVGRFEQPLVVNDSPNSEEAFLLTCEFLYYRNKTGGVNRVKIDDIEELKVKKALLSATVICKTRNETFELPQSLDKKNLDNIIKLIESVIFAVKEHRTAERMKAVKEAAALAKAEEDFMVVSKAENADEEANDSAENTSEIPGFTPIETETEAEKSDTEEAAASEAEVPADSEEITETAEKAEEADKTVSGGTEEKPSEAPVRMPVSTVKIVKVVPDSESAEKAPEKVLRTAEEITFDLDTISKGLAGLEDIAKELEQNITGKVDNMNDSASTDETKSAKPEEPEKQSEPAKTAEDSAARPKFCIECGAKVTSTTAKFCAECGAKLAS
ncbi:MAG: zinc ribbon domain-containing protein [Ruminococcus sp.]|jgi:hypothetical protein|nr:zinc ribbon domain-containing protein [Ruminococcus sp.]